MKTQASNYLYELLKKKYHTSEIVRAQIDEVKTRTRGKSAKEPMKAFRVTFQGQVIDTSFEKTLKIISRRLFHNGKIDTILTVKEKGLVEAAITATPSEIESLIQCLMKPHVVLHYKKGIEKGASNLLIIDETEQGQADACAPDYIHRNYITRAESYEKYTGRFGDYLILNGLPLTSEKLGRELRFNKIETKNKVFTTTGLKEIYVNLHFISLILKLDLEQHYLKLRIFHLQESEMQIVEEKIDDLGFFADIFNHIASTDNPLLFNKELFSDLMRLERIIENNNWKGIPAYAGYIYSASGRLNGQFKLLEECGLFLTYANCIEKFVARLTKKFTKNKPDIRSEQENLTANYHELKKLQTISKHQMLQNDYQELLNSFGKLLAYLDFLTIKDTGAAASGTQDVIQLAQKSSKKFGSLLKKCIEAVFSVTINISTKPVFRQDQVLKPEQEDIQQLIGKFSANLEKLSKLKTVSGKDAFLEAKKSVPLFTSLSHTLDELKGLIKDMERQKDIQDPLKTIFARSNKFEMLQNELNAMGILKNTQDQETAHGLLKELQGLLFDKPLKEVAYGKIINTVQSLEDFVTSRDIPAKEQNSNRGVFMQKLHQNSVFKKFVDIKAGLKNIIETETLTRRVNTFKNDFDFFSYSAKELDAFLTEIERFHEELKDTCYYQNVSEFEAMENRLNQLIKAVKDIDHRISLCTRNKDKKISKEPDVHIDYLKSSQLLKKNLEKATLLLQNQIAQIEGFMHDIESNLDRHSFIHSGVTTSVLFDQITYLLSNIDVRLIALTQSMEDMFKESVSTIFHYQVGEGFKEPQKEEMDDLMKEIDKLAIIKEYGNNT
ncbi:MAG: hypothetical protein DCC43_04090 [Candidatus Brocadia sp.]|nr:hypothetical protein [Candidatus Brocadia fulgida]MCC6326199.1 hypothetical protein [Candidatus Brocadia sp.]MCE7911208.1 hypothetical protein [Candidatus Brocadia sp. AMX3]MDG5996867.1 hypothetical protein [Candidatus Brocadia sp.]RIK02185.1 MAG: hypothetical protein DCC43_04090 [Candidatus Brocadia sp.]